MTAPAPQPTTSRIGGGSKARFVAIGLVATLALVVWVGMSGRPSPPPTVADASPTASALPSTVVETASPLPSEALQPTPSRSPAVAVGDYYLINGLVGRTSFSTELREISPDYLAGQLWLSDPPDGELLAFEISPPRTAALRQPPERESIGDDGILGCRAFSSCFWAADGGDVRP